MSHQLRGDLFRERSLKPTSDVDGGQFPVLAPVVCFEFRALKIEFGRSVSACEWTDTYSPAAIDIAPPGSFLSLRSDDVLKPAKPPIDSLHRLLCLSETAARE